MRRGPDGPRTLCNACGLMWANKVNTSGLFLHYLFLVVCIMIVLGTILHIVQFYHGKQKSVLNTIVNMIIKMQLHSPHLQFHLGSILSFRLDSSLRWSYKEISVTKTVCIFCSVISLKFPLLYFYYYFLFFVFALCEPQGTLRDLSKASEAAAPQAGQNPSVSKSEDMKPDL